MAKTQTLQGSQFPSLGDHLIDGEPMVYDLDLAGALGYYQPRDVRKLLTRLLGDGKLGTDGDRATAARFEKGRGVKAFYLGERA